jgi:hypothetical protein
MTYGVPNIVQRGLIDKSKTTFILGEEFFNRPFNKEYVAKEFAILSRFYSESTKEIREECAKIDEDPFYAFDKYLKKNNLEAYKDEVEKAADYSKVPIMTLKYHYNIPRTFMLAPYYAPDFKYMPSCFSQSPSYPSGHTIQAGVICNFYQKKYPERYADFEKIADKVALSRLIMGLHFPQDNIFSIQVAKQIVSKLNNP